MHTPDRRDFAFAADGPWDLRFFLHGECARKDIPKPAYYDKCGADPTPGAPPHRTTRGYRCPPLALPHLPHRWVNIKLAFAFSYLLIPSQPSTMCGYRWVNIKLAFADFYAVRPCKIHRMLQVWNRAHAA